MTEAKPEAEGTDARLPYTRRRNSIMTLPEVQELFGSGSRPRVGKLPVSCLARLHRYAIRRNL
jgi:hypothetical protein